MIAAHIPAEVKSSTPTNSPINPESLYPCRDPWVSIWPKLVIGTKAPPPAHKTILSYKLKTSKKAPITTNITVICPGVSLVLSNIICPIAHINPANKKAFKYIIQPPPNL